MRKGNQWKAGLVIASGILLYSGLASATCGGSAVYTLYEVATSTTNSAAVLNTTSDTAAILAAPSTTATIPMATGTSGGICKCGSTDASGCSSPGSDSNYPTGSTYSAVHALYTDSAGTLPGRTPIGDYFKGSLPSAGTTYSSIALAQTSTTAPCQLADGGGTTHYFYKVCLNP